MALIRDEPVIIGDTGPFCRFAEADALDVILDYLAESLIIVREVEAELNFRADQPEHKSLQRFREREPPYVRSDAVDLEQASRQRVEVIASRWRRNEVRRGGEDRGVHSNVGEIATAVAAKEQKAAVLMDDGRGKDLATSWKLTAYTSEELLVEMVTQKALGRRLAVRIFERIYGRPEADFNAAVKAAEAADTQFSSSPPAPQHSIRLIRRPYPSPPDTPA